MDLITIFAVLSFTQALVEFYVSSQTFSEFEWRGVLIPTYYYAVAILSVAIFH